jgi:hypothetical protein
MPTQVIRGNPSGVRAGRGPMLIRACDSVFGFEFQTAGIKTVIASDSEAIHRAASKVRVDCFVVSLLAMTEDMPSRSRGAIRPSFAENFPPSPIRGRRESRVHAAPAVSCARCTKECAHEHTGSAENTRPSLRNGLRLITCSSRRTAFLPPSPPGSFASRELDTSAAVPEPHAFAVRLARARLSHVRRPPHPIATFVTIATRPSFG